MSQNLDVFVRDAAGNPAPDTPVTIIVQGIFSGGTIESRTDAEGRACFETAGDYDGTKELTIEVEGREFGPYYLICGRYVVQLS